MALTRNQELKMFGCTIASMLEAYKNVSFGYTKPFYAMAILSDAQHVLEHGDAETCRQFINKAKYFLADAHEELVNRKEVKHG